jgi:hypothetical protein
MVVVVYPTIRPQITDTEIEGEITTTISITTKTLNPKTFNPKNCSNGNGSGCFSYDPTADH